MPGIKRKMNCHDPVPSKKSRKELKDFHANAWREELIVILNDDCDIEISDDISDMIYDYAIGEWDPCTQCKELTDPKYSHALIIDKSVGLYCERCYPWSGSGSSEYSFDIEYDEGDE